MKKKSTFGIIVTVLLIIIGIIISNYYAVFSGNSFYGYIDYCKEVKLNFDKPIVVAEIASFFGFLAFYSALEFFRIEVQRFKFYIIFSCFILLNIIFMSHRIIEYPIIIRTFSFANQYGRSHLYNPLIYISFFYLFLFAWWSFRFAKNNHQLKIIKLIIPIFFATITIAVATISFSVKYRECMG